MTPGDGLALSEIGSHARPAAGWWTCCRSVSLVGPIAAFGLVEVGLERHLLGRTADGIR